jgi:hypothetical protein
MNQNKAKVDYTLIAGDLVVLLSFVLIGRGSHGLSVADMFAGVWTALPFVLSWFLVAPWLGLYSPTINRKFANMLPRLLATWLISVPIAHVVRALLLGRPVPAGIPLTFVLVSLAYIGGVMLVWRSGYIWWQQRKIQKAEL